MKKKDHLLHHSACFSLLLFILVLFGPNMAVCAVPTLNWTGEYGLWNDGVNPDYGIRLTDSFTFQIAYQDADNNPPEAGYPMVHIKKGGVDISGSPFTLTEVDALDTNYQNGKFYTYSTTLSQAGNDYTYSFAAYNSTSQNAYGIPTYEHTLTAVTGYVWVDKVLGNDTAGNGSELNPYQTITKGLSVALAGQAVKVRGGTIASPYTYSETFDMVNGVHLVSDNGDGGDSEVLYDDPYSTYQTKILTRTGRVIIQGLVSFPVEITEDVLLDGFTIDYIPGKSAVRMDQNSPVIRNNIVRRGNKAGVECIAMKGSVTAETAPIIENNLVHSVGSRAISIAAYVDVLIQDNEIWNCGQSGIGVNSKGTPTTLTALNNHVFNNGWSGIANQAMVKGSEVTITGNIIKDNGLDPDHGGAGVFVKRCCAPGTVNVIIGGSEPGQENTIYNNSLAGIRLDSTDLGMAALVQNNDIYDNGTAGINLIDVGTITTTATVMDNNIHGHVNGAGINTGGSTYVDIAYNSIYDNKAGLAFNMTEMALLGVDPDPPSSGMVGIEKNEINSNSLAGIIVKDAITGEVTIAGNDIYQNDRGGIGIVNSCNLIINNNDIHNNIRGGIHTGTDIADDFFNDPELTDTEGFIGLPDSALLTVTQNKVHNNGLNSYGGGIDIRHASGPINNNLVYKNRMGGIRFGDYITEIVNNTVVENGDEVQEKGGGIIYDDLAGAVNDPSAGSSPAAIPIRNNISILNARAGIRDGICRDIRPARNTERNYNLLYMNNKWKYTYPVHAPSNLGGCWPNANELFADPLFIDWVNDDYRIQFVSPAVDTGDSAYGNDVSIPPGVGTIAIDIGAFGGPDGIDW